MYKGHTLFGARRSRTVALYNDALAWDRKKSRPKTVIGSSRRQVIRRKQALRNAEIQRNALALNADLKAGLPRLSNMVARSMLHSHREECKARSERHAKEARAWTVGAFLEMTHKYGPQEARDMLISTGHDADTVNEVYANYMNKLSISPPKYYQRDMEHAAQLLTVKQMYGEAMEDNDPHPWTGDLNTLF